MGALGYASTANASNAMRQSGLELANQKMEQARNLSYDSLGTTNGYPTGTITTPETVVVTTPEGDTDIRRGDSGGLGGRHGNGLGRRQECPHHGVMDQSRGQRASQSSRTWWVSQQSPTPVTSRSTSWTPIRAIRCRGRPSRSSRPGGMTVSATTGSTGFVRWGKVPTGSIVDHGHLFDALPRHDSRRRGSVLNGQPTSGPFRPRASSTGIVHVTDQLGNDLPGVTVTITGPAASAGWSCPSGTGSAISDAEWQRGLLEAAQGQPTR